MCLRFEAEGGEQVGVLRRRVTLICVDCTGGLVPSHMTVFRREVSHSSVASQALKASCPHTDTARAPDRACPHPPFTAPFLSAGPSGLRRRHHL